MKKNYIALLLLISAFNLFAQLKIGADLYSRYIWRGMDFGDSPSIQPTISFTSGSLTFGVWSAYSLPGNNSNYSESDFFASFTIPTASIGSFTLYYTDYYFPYLGLPFGSYKKNGGAHTLEGGIGYNGPEAFPISLSGYLNFYNDADNSSYIQIGYPITVGETALTFSAGFTPSKSSWYVVDKGTILYLGASAVKSVSITDKLSIPFTLTYVINPYLDQSFLAFGASLIF